MSTRESESESASDLQNEPTLVTLVPRSKSKIYTVHSMFLTLQGEAGLTGTPALFIRLSGCNIWNGKHDDRERATSSCGLICDTEFSGVDESKGGGKYTLEDLYLAACKHWEAPGHQLVVFTGGEPMLQLDRELVQRFYQNGWRISLETNGTVPFDDTFDGVEDAKLNIVVSPKYGERWPVLQQRYHEVKLLWPTYSRYMEEAAKLAPVKWLQPTDLCVVMGNVMHAMQQDAAAKVLKLRSQGWRLSLQTHKLLGIL